MTDFESFHAAMRDRADTSYMSSLVQSMGLVLEEFYEQLRVVGCSALTGRGMDEFFDAVAEAVKEYESEYLPDVQARMRKRAQEQEAGKAESMAKLIKDLNLKGGDINAEAEAPAH